MNLKEFTRSGHLPTLFASFLYFDVSFMVWVLIGALGVSIAEEFALSGAEKGLLVGLPILAGAILRIGAGMGVDRFGAKRLGALGLVLTLVPLAWGWLGVTSASQLFGVGLCLGIAGASFAVALPLGGQWFPAHQQGLAMGIAAAGNSGTVIAALFAPRLAEVFGWRGVFGLSIVPVSLVLIAFLAMAKENPARRPAARGGAAYRELLRSPDAWWLAFLYLVTFGGFVGLASWLPLFFHDVAGLERVSAGNWTAAAVFCGSFARPLGGFFADRLGGIRVLVWIYGVVAGLALVIATLPPLALLGAAIFAIMAALGAGNGAVFQLVPQRFPRTLGTATGLVGAAGGIGGFFLPVAIGGLEDWTGNAGAGFLLLGLAAVAACGLLLALATEWRRGWAGEVTA